MDSITIKFWTILALGNYLSKNVKLLIMSRGLTRREWRIVAEKVWKRLEYWKKHNPEKYKEYMRYIRMAQGEIV